MAVVLRKHKGFLFVMALMLAIVNVRAQPTTDRTSISQARSVIEKTLQKEDYPGIAVAVWHDGKQIWSEGFGFASIADSIPVDPSRSLFRIGSISKTLTAACLAVLVEKHGLDLDAPIEKYVPYFPEKRWPVTTLQVAQHVAGIRHYRGMEFLSNTQYNSVEEALGVFMYDTLMSEPGSKYAYSSYGWNLVSAVIEGASEKPFTNYIKETVFTPLGMEHTYPDDVALMSIPRVTFYEQMNGMNIISPQVNNSIKWAGGGFLSTAEDLIRFGEGILNYSLTTQETTTHFWTPGTLNDGSRTNYGIGWSTNTDKHGYYWVGHAGGSVGGSSMLLIYPDHNLIVVTLINRSRAGAADLAFTVADQFLPVANTKDK